MADLKSGWKRVKFGDVVRLVKETCKDPAAAGIERVIGLEHLAPGDLRIRSWADIADGTTFTTRVRPGQVLFGKRRAYQRKVAVADFDAICSGDIYVFESANTERLLPELLPFICQTDAFFEYAVGTSAGSLSPRTNWSSLAQYEFALPTLEAQRKATTVLDTIEQTLEEIGALVTAATQQRQSIGCSVFGKLSTPCRVGDCVIESAYGPRFPGTDYDPAGNVFTLRTTDFSAHGRINFDAVPAARLEMRVAEQHRLVDGDFLLSRSGEYAGMTRVFRACESPDRCYIPAAFLIRFRLDRAKLLPDYLFEFCESPQGSVAVRSLAKGSAQPNISGTGFLGLSIPAVPIEKQHADCALLAQARGAELSAEQRRDRLRQLRSTTLNHILREGA